jgi:hypothetical protein
MEIFQREVASPELFEEVLPILVEHDAAASDCPQESVNPRIEVYLSAESTGSLRVFTARNELTGELLGYSAYFVGPHLQKQQIVQAEEHGIFIRPKFRGFGDKFGEWIEEQLWAEGVDAIARTSKLRPDINRTRSLERAGYEAQELIFFKRRVANG